jgi:hypothetical protein
MAAVGVSTRRFCLLGGLSLATVVAGCGGASGADQSAASGPGAGGGVGTGSGATGGSGGQLATGAGGAGGATSGGGGHGAGTTTSAGGGGGAGAGGGADVDGGGACKSADDCDDHDACTDDDCKNGSCVHAQVDSNDGDACTVDSCDPALGPRHAPVDPNDNDDCTVDSCDPASGVQHVSLGVDDGDPCTVDSCDPAQGLAHTPVDPNDNDVCTVDSCDPVAGVQHAAVDVDDSDACTNDACDPITGPSHTPVDVDDKNACTQDACDPIGGVTHTAISCDDANPCTDDSCNPKTGCVHTFNVAPCDDGDACTKNDACAAGVCSPGAAVVCVVLDQCHAAGVCVPATGECPNPPMPDGTPCDDGDPSTIDDVCTGGACAGVVCKAGTFHCNCNQVLKCDPGPPAKWVPMAPDLLCSVASNQRCDAATGTCKALTVTGSNVPTGTYYQYATFTTGNSVFKGGYDVASFGENLYVNRDGSNLDVYKVVLVDPLGDPDQHPNNPKSPGPMVGRTLTLVATYTKAGDKAPLGPASTAEMYATADALFSLGPTRNGDVTQWLFADHTTKVVADSLTSFPLSHLGYGGIDKAWYGSNETARRVYSFCPGKQLWVPEFQYPDLTGGHMDGLEVVWSSLMGFEYVYVSDMTSDFLGQYRRDANGGWVQENLFKYSDVTGSAVEGLGFGTFKHFWATGGSTLYEIGGGDLGMYIQ